MKLFIKTMLVVFFGLMAAAVFAAPILAVSAEPDREPVQHAFSAEDRAFLTKHGAKLGGPVFAACNQCHKAITEDPIVTGAPASPSYRAMSMMKSVDLVKMIQHNGSVPSETAKKIFSTINSLRTKQVRVVALL